MRQKYHSEALVLKTSDFKESNKLYHLFTRKFGLILATAQSVRFSKSKLRYGLQDYSVCNVSLVRTGDIWKVTNCTPIKNYYFDLKNTKKKLDATTRTMQFLRRFLHGEQEELKIYTDMKDGVDFLYGTDDSNTLAIEAILLLKLLNTLGILENSVATQKVTESKDWNNSLSEFNKNKREIIELINKSLSESQL